CCRSASTTRNLFRSRRPSSDPVLITAATLSRCCRFVKKRSKSAPCGRELRPDRSVKRPPNTIGPLTSRAFWAPGRVNLIGEHTAYSGGLVLPAALDLGIRIDADTASGIRLESAIPRLGPIQLPADGGAVADTADWGRYVAAVAIELAELGRPPVGLDGHIRSTLPMEAGLSSSAALEVAVATAL